MIFWIVKKIVAGYIISTFIFLLLTVFLKSFRRRTSIFLNKANLILIFILLINIIWTGEETIKCLGSQNDNPSISSTDTWTNADRHCAAIFVGTLLFAFLFQSIFFFNQYRTKVTFTIGSIVLLTFFYTYEGLIINITSLYRDYLPSSWSIYYDWTGTVWTIIFSVLFFALCWSNRLTLKKKRLKSG